jgi:hypothetical protein
MTVASSLVMRYFARSNMTARVTWTWGWNAKTLNTRAAKNEKVQPETDPKMGVVLVAICRF